MPPRCTRLTPRRKDTRAHALALLALPLCAQCLLQRDKGLPLLDLHLLGLRRRRLGRRSGRSGSSCGIGAAAGGGRRRRRRGRCRGDGPLDDVLVARPEVREDVAAEALCRRHVEFERERAAEVVELDLSNSGGEQMALQGRGGQRTRRVRSCASSAETTSTATPSSARRAATSSCAPSSSGPCSASTLTSGLSAWTRGSAQAARCGEHVSVALGCATACPPAPAAAAAHSRRCPRRPRARRSRPRGRRPARARRRAG